MLREPSLQREALIKLQAVMIVAVIVCAAVIGVYVSTVIRHRTAPTPPPSAPISISPEGVLKRIVKVEAEEEMLHYWNESFWDENSFSEILKSRDEFKLEEINYLNRSLQKYGKVMVNPDVKFDEKNKSTILICDIKGAMYSENSYDFHWLLANLPFDLYAFKQYEKELKYEGEINGILTTIKLIFPFKIAHCHEHVWKSG